MIFVHPFQLMFIWKYQSSRGDFLLLGTDVSKGGWGLSLHSEIHPNSFLSGWGKDSLQTNLIHAPDTTLLLVFMDLDFFSCHRHARTGNDRCQDVPTKLEWWNILEFLSLEQKGQGSWKTTLLHNLPVPTYAMA